MHSGVIEIVAVYPPRLIEDLWPFRSRIYPDCQCTCIQHTLAGLRFPSCSSDTEGLPLAVEHLFAVSRDNIVVEFHHLLILPVLKAVLMQR